ncbi:UDP-GlcNAc:betaGal beta-1,3-N-acetylglucosaminyltransferase 7-like isoform X1 [Triplophysa dalaica]|uniref:UDP-GlcNAc:betaGal beta-1,3-N-acetylglucosaminyltransferase 7-like isoform X1 n=2 Tax=Triplophysa dalaica TaxID=1582913 RepID=UPI0024E014A3|nr:UDP-GlcNAc:betaGal beta-1,3-N-acetylglucosaminyltransferase 7-like isoform X1 [Triplophysa dalaica]
MMITREQQQVYKHMVFYSLMFFIVVVVLSVIYSANISSIQDLERIERQTHMKILAEVDLQNKGFLHNFWGNSMQPVLSTTENPVINQDQRPTTWDICSSNCSPNHNFSSLEWFKHLEFSFKQFLLYRHCRYFPILMNHPEKCAEDVDLLMVIKSVITQYDRREVIRQTWGKEQVIEGKIIKTLFLLGTSCNEEERANHQKLLEYEDHIYGDIIQWDFMDSFFNLTLKEIHFLKWFSTYCGNTRYIFKGDDDVFVNVPNILEYLRANVDLKGLFVGHVFFKAKPIRKKENKYYIPQALYKKTHYPPYAGGGGFLMDGPLARKLYGACETLELYPIDDVFLGMCLEVLQVTPIKHNAFKTFGLVINKSSKLNREPCFFKAMIVVHKLLPPDLINMWKLVNSDLVCSQKMDIEQLILRDKKR